MAQQINDTFQLLAALPIDDRIKKANITERDAIPTTRRYQGLQCFVEQTETLYLLSGGVENTDWIGVFGGNIADGIETVIEGFYVLSAGKTTLSDWEVGDKFRGWIANRYVVGTILTLPVSLPGDIDNALKVELAVDSDGFTFDIPTVTEADYIATVEADGSIAKIDPVNLPFTQGSGTTNTVPLFTDTKTLGNSILTQNSDGLKIGSTNTTYGIGLSVSKLITAINKHTFDDYSVINTVSGNEGYGVFDASTEMTGSNSNDHLNGYQSRLNYSASVGMTGPNFNIYGMTGYLSQNRITGTGHLTVAKGFFARDLGGVAGTVDNLYGLHIDPQTKGSVTNWDIHATGKNNHFGAVMIGAVPAQWNAVDSFVNTGISNFSGLTKHTSQVRISSPSNTIPALQIGDYIGNFGWGIFESNTTGNLFVNSKNSGAVVQGFEIARNTGNTTFYGSITAPNATLTGTPAAPTATAGTNTTQVATTAFVTGAISTASSSATYTPTLTNTTNITSSSLSLARYSKVGKLVTAYVALTLSNTVGSVASRLKITLPSTAVTSSAFGNGIAYEATVGMTQDLIITSSGSSTQVDVDFLPSAVLNRTLLLSFSYMEP